MPTPYWAGGDPLYKIGDRLRKTNSPRNTTGVPSGTEFTVTAVFENISDVYGHAYEGVGAAGGCWEHEVQLVSGPEGVLAEPDVGSTNRTIELRVGYVFEVEVEGTFYTSGALRLDAAGEPYIFVTQNSWKYEASHA